MQPHPRPNGVVRAWRLYPPWCACPVSLPRCRVSVCLSGLPRLECLPALGDDLSCLLGCLLVRCRATQLFSTMFTLGYSCCCACVRRARGVPVCLRMFAQHAARFSRSDILPWARPFGSSCSFFLDSLSDFFHECPLQHSRPVRCVQSGVVSGFHDTWLECGLCSDAPRALCLFRCMR